MAALFEDAEGLMKLELEDGFSCQGYSFGAQKSVAGELVFQTGMVGYPETLTDPSYRGQILVCTFPLQGNYGVPSRETMDELLKDVPAYFEAAEIHVAGLVVASYSGENYSHFLAKSSLGVWLKENGIPAIHGVDTRALTKRIRDEGSMLGRLLFQDAQPTPKGPNGAKAAASFKSIPFSNQNEENLVADGEAMRTPTM